MVQTYAKRPRYASTHTDDVKPASSDNTSTDKKIYSFIEKGASCGSITSSGRLPEHARCASLL
jgi:hypothetical protein